MLHVVENRHNQLVPKYTFFDSYHLYYNRQMKNDII